jgi:hypothetical protein
MEEEMRDPKEVLMAVIQKAMEAKYELCLENGGMFDSPPFLIGEFPNGDGFIAPDLMEGHPTDTLPVMLTGLLEGMTETYGTPKFQWLAYVCEGYCKPNIETMPDDWQRGAMEQEYKENPLTDIREGIIATVFPWEGAPLADTVLYRYNDNGLPEYEEPLGSAEGTGGGAIPDIFAQFLAHCHKVVDAKNN